MTKSNIVRRLFAPQAVVMAIAFVLPACEQFVCSQERIKAIELNNRGVDAFKNNLYDSAEKDLKEAIAKDPGYEMSYYNLGKVYQKQRKWDKAIEQFEQATQRQPNNENFQYDLGEAYFQVKKLDQAEKAFAAATAANEKLFKGWWYLGMIRKLLDHPKEADEALRKSIEQNPRFAKSFVALGYLYLDYDFNKEAAQVFQGCVVGNENDGECHNGLGLALKNLKQYEQATAEFKKAIDLDPELFDALYNAGMAYSDWFDESHGNDQKDKAREYLQKFVTNGAKTADGNYVKAANDKLYALSGP